MTKKLAIFLFLLFVSLGLSSVDEFYRKLKISHFLSYDFIVVGAGSAGSVVANKLSNHRQFQVLLVEEGGYSTEIYEVLDSIQYINKYVYNVNQNVSKVFETEPTKYVNNRTISSIRGMVVGGCNSINAMVAFAGNDYDYNGWANLTNEPQWSWDNSVHPIHLPDIFNHIPIRRNDESIGYNKELKQAIEKSGHVYFENQYEGKTTGYTIGRSLQRNDTNGFYRRVTSFSQYVDPVSRKRRNLGLLVRHKVLKIDFEDRFHSPPIARGIYLKDLEKNEYIYVLIRKELILSAGAYDTPLLLQFSGVGDPAHLSSLGIRTIINSPSIGRNLEDHNAFPFFGKPFITTNGIPRYYRIDDAPYRIFGPKNHNDFQKIKWIVSTSTEKVPQVGPVYSCSLEVVETGTKGYIQIEKLTENFETYERPRIHLDHLSNPVSMENMIQALNSCFEIQRNLEEMGFINPNSTDLSGLSQSSTKAEVESFLRKSVITAFHPHGTAKMGHWRDTSAPTYPNLRLKGSANVRIIDASIIPVSPSGNTNMPVIIIGLQGSRFILRDHL